MSKEVNELRKKLGQRGFKRVLRGLKGKVAGFHRFMTNKEAVELARQIKRKGATIRATAVAVGRVAKILEEARRTPGWARRRGIGISSWLERLWALDDKKALPQGTIRQRLEKRYEQVVGRAVRECLRQYSAQRSSRVQVVPSFAEATGSLHTEGGWITRGRYYSYGIARAAYEIAVMRGWLILPSWLRTCDGLLTLAAIRVPEEERADLDGEGRVATEEVYRAKWARMGRVEGEMGVRVEEGFVVRYRRVEVFAWPAHDQRRRSIRRVHSTSYTAHGSSIAAARRSIAQRLPEAVSARTERARAKAEAIDRAKALVVRALERGHLNGYDVLVTLADSHRAGNCRSGTAHWVAKFFPGQGEALVSEILAVRSEHERALLACVAAIRRQRPEVFEGVGS